MAKLKSEISVRRTVVEAALGQRLCDLIVRNVTLFDVFSCRWKECDVAVFAGTIVGLDSGLKAKREIRGRGKFAVPGFIDAHVHLESSMMVPQEFQKAVLARGTTTAICDPHELANVQGIEGIRYFLKASEKLALDLRVMLSSCVPATHLETNGGGNIKATDLRPLRSHPKALGLAEMMNVPGVLNGDAGVWAKLKEFSDSVIDGHCPLLSGPALSAYTAAGISSCHESTRLDEAQEKLLKGIAVWIREGSVAKDLKRLAPLLDLASSARVGFCTDDRNPLDIGMEGHIDHLIRSAIAQGVPMEAAYRSSSWTVARHYGLRGIGALAPGYRADIVLLGDRETCAVESVLTAGVPLEDAALAPVRSVRYPNSVRAKPPSPEELRGPEGRVHVIGVESGKILTSRSIENHDARGVAHLSVLERHGKKSPPANGYVRGFGSGFRGAIASSVGHDSHNLIAVGSSLQDMALALGAIIESGGGYSVAQNGSVKALLKLPLGGLMSPEPAEEIRKALKKMRFVCRNQGCELDEPFLQLAFLSLPVIPSLKLTDKGLVDVEKFQIIDVRAP